MVRRVSTRIAHDGNGQGVPSWRWSRAGGLMECRVSLRGQGRRVLPAYLLRAVEEAALDHEYVSAGKPLADQRDWSGVGAPVHSIAAGHRSSSRPQLNVPGPQGIAFGCISGHGCWTSLVARAIRVAVAAGSMRSPEGRHGLLARRLSVLPVQEFDR